MDRSFVLAFLLAASSISMTASALPGDVTLKAKAMSTDQTMLCVVFTDNTAGCYDQTGLSVETTSATTVVSISAGYFYNCALLSDRNVDCTETSAAAPDGAAVDLTGRNVLRFVAGRGHSCAIFTTRNVQCYGDNEFGERVSWSGGDAIDVALGEAHTCILRASRNVVCYGDNSEGQLAGYSGGDAVDIDAGVYHTCIVRANGQTHCWGDGVEGGASPVLASGGAVKVGANTYGEPCVLFASGDVECEGGVYLWGAGVYYGGDAIDVDGENGGWCALLRTGNVYCAGVFAQPPFFRIDIEASETSDGTAICDDWNNDGECSEAEQALLAPGATSVNGPTGVALGADDDGDGVPASVVVESGTTTFDPATGDVSSTTTSSESFGLDPDDGDANDPARVGAPQASLDWGCETDTVCVRAGASAGAAGDDLTQWHDVPIEVGAAADVAHDATGHRPYSMNGDGLTLHGAGSDTELGTPPAHVDGPQHLDVGEGAIDLGCAAPGSVSTPTIATGGILQTNVPAQTRPEPPAVTSVRCTAQGLVGGDTSVPLEDVSV